MPMQTFLGVGVIFHFKWGYQAQRNRNQVIENVECFIASHLVRTRL